MSGLREDGLKEWPEQRKWLGVQEEATVRSKNKEHDIWSHDFIGRMGKQWKLTDFIFWAPKSLQMVTAAMKLKDSYSLEGKL